MSPRTLEERVAQLEHEVVQLKRRLLQLQKPPWWEQISGVFADAPAFDEAAALGRQVREPSESDDQEAQ